MKEGRKMQKPLWGPRVANSLFGQLLAGVLMLSPVLAQTVSAPLGQRTEVQSLSLQEAIQFAIENNLNTRLSNERKNESLGARLQALAALMPNVSASASQSSNTINLAAQGL